ncbi:MAG: glycosyltransferase family 2 protein [Lyngbya sp.]|nr:glycosyltransferase family 2 protein [Lyngbya sp.]
MSNVNGSKSQNLTRVLVVIVNYCTPSLTINCLRSLQGEVQSFPGIWVAVADNDSGDNSVEQIQRAIASEHWEDWVNLIPLERNGGYAFGNNAVIRPALQWEHPPDYFLLLNPDTVVYPGAIETLVNFMESHPNVGLAGSGMESAEGVPKRRSFRFHTILSEFDGGLRLGIVSKLLSNWATVKPMPDEPAPADWLPGASLMVRRQVFESVGLLDEGYFLYYEETDFCLQAKRGGWSCWRVPESRVMHMAGQSTGVTTPGSRKRLPQYWFDSRRRYFIKNHGWMYAVVADTVWILGFACWRFRRIIQQKPDPDPPHFLSDFIRHSAWFNFQ